MFIDVFCYHDNVVFFEKPELRFCGRKGGNTDEEGKNEFFHAGIIDEMKGMGGFVKKRKAARRQPDSLEVVFRIREGS